MTEATHADLTVLTGGPSVEVNAGGETIRITPIKVRELAALSKAAAPLAGSNIDDIPALLLAHPEAVAALVAVACRKPIEFVENLDIDELVLLAAACLEVNADFFARRVLPAITQATQRLQPLMVGSTSMPGFDGQATATG